MRFITKPTRIVRASGTWMDASWLTGVIAP